MIFLDALRWIVIQIHTIYVAWLFAILKEHFWESSGLALIRGHFIKKENDLIKGSEMDKEEGKGVNKLSDNQAITKCNDKSVS